MTSGIKRKKPADLCAIEIITQVHDARWKSALRPYGKTIRTACEAVLRSEKFSQATLSVVLMDDDSVRKLNCSFRHKDKPTNVLSFVSAFDQKQRRLEGDIVLAYETIRSEAKTQGKTVKAHVVHLLVHGVLHLLGYDHEDERQAQQMESREINILAGLGVVNPYL